MRRAAGGGMPLTVESLALGALEQQLRAHAAPPPSLDVRFKFSSTLGPCCFKFDKQKSVPGANSRPAGAGGDDCYVGAWLSWGGAAADAPLEVRASLQLTALARDGAVSQVMAFWVPANGMGKSWRKGLVHGYECQLTWSALRRAVVDDGCRLELAVTVLPDPAPVGLDDGSGGGGYGVLHVPGGDRGTCAFPAACGVQLDGPFTDATLRAGDRQWRAHRVVLAAASPALRSMLESDMVEGREAAVELRDADPDAVELLLRHIYGGAVDVPLRAALALYSLADQYQLASGLARSLRVWLAGVTPSPGALAALLPAASSVCRPLGSASWYDHAAAAIEALAGDPGFGELPLYALAEVLGRVPQPLHGFGAAAAWAAAQDAAGRPSAPHWPLLLKAIDWGGATCADLAGVMRHPGAFAVPDIGPFLLLTAMRRLAAAEAGLAAAVAREALAAEAAEPAEAAAAREVEAREDAAFEGDYVALEEAASEGEEAAFEEMLAAEEAREAAGAAAAAGNAPPGRAAA
jgi:hypothetical protein